MTDVLLPPDIQPETEDVELVDDGTQLFIPQFAQGAVQAAQYFEPYVKVTQTFKGLRQSDRARIMAMLGRLKGRYNTLRALVGYSLRGSFPATELFTNNTFANGTTGWSTEGTYSLSASDGTIRMLRSSYDGSPNETVAPYQTLNLTQYAPYVTRANVVSGLGGLNAFMGERTYIGGLSGGITASGIAKATFIPYNVSNSVGLVNTVTIGVLGGEDYYETNFMSLAKCALVDNGPNYLTYSDQFDNAAWTKTRCSVSASATVAPDGTTTADSIIEDSSTNTHAVQYSNIAVSSWITDYCVTVALKAGSRTWAMLELFEATSSTSATAFINLSTGTIGTTAAGANWSNLRAFSTALGNGWYQLTIVARKINAATTIGVDIYTATANGTISYTGNGSGNVYAWRATLALSSVPIKLSQSSGSAVQQGTPQTGNSIYVKGLPPSTNGLLLLGDPFEIGGELKICTSALNSDAAGLGYLQFAPALFRSPADSDPVIIGLPFGKFKLAENPKWSNRYGQYADLTLVMRGIYE